MNRSRFKEPENRTENDRLVINMANWVQTLAPWQVFATLTFSKPAPLWSAVKWYERFMKKELWGVSNFYAVEKNPSSSGFHVHSLWVDCQNLSRRDIWKEWFGRFGRARIVPVRGHEDVSDYCAKYVCKEGSWWNVKLVGSRHPSFYDDFKLSNLVDRYP